jgi:hypothetical protein
MELAICNNGSTTLQLIIVWIMLLLQLRVLSSFVRPLITSGSKLYRTSLIFRSDTGVLCFQNLHLV